MGQVLRFRNVATPRQSGELARFKVVQGPDVGLVFVIIHQPVTIGRGEENDIVLSDLKASRKHAEAFIKAGQSTWSIEDKGSSNGILYNQSNVRASQLNSGDLITLGQTTLQFYSEATETAVLSAPPKALTEIKKEEAALEAHKKSVRDLAKVGTPTAIQQMIKNMPKSAGQSNSKKVNPLILIAVIATFVIFVLFPDGDKKKVKPQSKNKTTPVDLSNYLPDDSNTSVSKAADAFFKGGFREYREKNYLRAKIQFKNALMVSPTHALAKLYLENCEQRIKEEVQFELGQGKKQYRIGKVKESKGHYENVLRLLYMDVSNPAYIEAQNKIKELDQDQDLNDLPNSSYNQRLPAEENHP